jgi:hypothetical protein
MTKNTQEYINNLLNKHKTFYLDLSSPCQVSQCSHCKKKKWEETTPNLTGEIEDLKEFQNLRGINASNNKFTNLNGLFTLPNKNKVEKINLFGNKISEVDLPRLFTEFPNLKYLNLDRNPLSAKNLENLTSEQLEKLAEGMKSKQIRISANQGTILSDLLEYTQKLIKKGGSSTSSAHKLQAIIQNGPVKNSEQEPNKMSYIPWIIGGAAVVSLAVMIGYLLGKRGKDYELED